MRKITVRIQRFDPAKDALPYFDEYEVELEAGITLLNTLNKIKWEQDQTLAYRYSCGSAICGSCAMKINGHATLICKTQALESVRNDVIEIAPVGNATILRDLVVDLEPFWESLRRVTPWLQPGNDSQKGSHSAI